MQVFLSWSKAPSRDLARVLRDWLPEVIQSLQPWMSQEDVSKGQRWSLEIAAALDATAQGLVLVTPDNVNEPWLNFEAGALAKSMADAQVRPVLLGLQPHELEGPLAQFQATVVTDRDDMFRLVTSLNEAQQHPIDPTRLARSFDRAWSELQAAVSTISLTQPVHRERTAPEMLAELIDRVRTIERAVGAPLAAPSPTGPKPRNDYEFRVGQVVHHETFGRGVVVAAANDGDSREATVTFDGLAGTKRLLTRYAPMVPEEPPF